MALTETNYPEKLFSRGKVRDVYDLGDLLLVISTDRISAFDVVLPKGIPNKGFVLNVMTADWLKMIQEKLDIPTHLLTEDFSRFPGPWNTRDELENRSMLVWKAKPLPVECIVRGYLAGSGWKEYQKTGTVCGIQLPAGLRESYKLPEPIFTPSTKAEIGTHDENISFNRAVDIVGRETAEKIKQFSLEIYEMIEAYAIARGIILADTKFEFGYRDGELMLIDEVATPDSSRFWPADWYEPGKPQKSLDKQFVRDYLESINWNKKPPAPDLPDDIVKLTEGKYLDILNRLKNEAITVR